MSVIERKQHVGLDSRPSTVEAPALDLPADRPRLPVPSGRRAMAEGAIAPELARALEGVAPAAQVQAVMAGFVALLGRTSGQRRFRLTVDRGGRRATVAADLEGRPGLGALTARLAAAVADAGLGAQGTLRVAAGGPFPDSAADLRLQVDEAATRLALDADGDRFDDATVGRLADRLRRLLATGAEDPERPVSALPCLGEAEERSIFETWSDGGPRAGDAACLHDLFAARVAATPDADALVAGEERWTYRDLDRRAAAVAARLAELGVGPEVRVGVFLDRGPHLLAALLGVLKAGGAYVPLDPEYPQQRVAFMLADSGAVAVLTRRELADLLPDGDAETLLLEELPEGGAAPAVTPNGRVTPDGHVTPDNLAYVIYTSGSTGRPKGVAIRHAAAAAMLGWAQRHYPAEDLAGSLACTSMCFDLSVYEIFLPLTRGGTVILAADALELPKLPAADQVVLVNTVPSAMTELMRGAGLPASVRTVNLAGEPLPRELVERLYEAGVERVFNLYGPSEDTTYSTWELVPRGADLPVTIGAPVAGTRAWVVDGDLRPVGVGVPGELLLGGAGVARGYLGRPSRTAGSFVPDPFADGDGGGRLYRTGDLVRWRPDGRLDFLGRIDHQVKVRGFRIELGEIAAVLEGHPRVRQAVAVVHAGAGGEEDRRIVAYWVPEAGGDGPPPSAEELRETLGQRLPAYMIPSHLLRLDEMPLTPNGKVDRKALPEPGGGRPDLEVPYAPPESASERELAELWAELLGIDRVGIDDDLVSLGGHSLLAAQIAARVQERRDVELTVAEVFAHPTVRRLAALVDSKRPGEQSLPPLEPVDREVERHLPLSFQQEQVWIINQLAPDNLAYNFQYTIRFRGPLDRAILDRTLSEIVRRHEVLHTVFVDGPEGPEQKVLEPWTVRVPLADLSALPAERREAEAERLAHRLVRHRFDVSRLPLVAWTLLRLSSDDHLFVQAEQHFIHDGWSISVILREIEEIYAAFAAGRPCPLPELPVQFGDFAVWQREALRGDRLRTQLDYWTDQMEDLPPPLDLPTDRPRPREQSFVGDRLDVALPPDLYARVREMGRREGHTLFTTLTAAFEILMTLYSGQEDFLFGSGVANRRLKESEPLIGMIVNTLVMRADTSGDPTYRQLLERVRERALGMQTHPDLPLEHLVKEVAPDRDLSRNPLFQVMFSFHDAPVPDLEFAGMSGDLVERHNGSAKSDMNIIIKPRAEQRLGRGGSDEDQVLKVLWEFATDLFDRSTVERMWRHYLSVLRQVVADPGVRLSRVSLLDDEERRDVVVERNATAAAFPRSPAVQRLVDEHPAQAPAVVDAAGDTWTYGDLRRHARRLAAELARRGVGAEDRVAVCVSRSPRGVAALLGVLQSGAAYIPVDPHYPARRIAAMVEHGGAKALLTDPAVEPQLPEVAVPRLDVTGELPDADGFTPVDTAPEQLAYVIFTSGSTGRPKGVAVPHAGLANLVHWHLRTYRLGAEDRCPHLAGQAFDASVWEIWPVLAAGACLHLPDEETRATPERLRDWLVERRVTVAFVPTPMAERILPLEWPAGTALRAMLTGGDALHRHPRPGLPFRLVNHYGPTENTVVASAGDVTPRSDGETVARPHIGGPIANVRCLVLDRRLEPVPPGVPGELYVGGDSLARGYLGRPGRTADAFVPDPFAAEGGAPGARLYRTGDRVLWSAGRSGEGVLEFLGRVDFQVQVRGFRIELGEIETVMGRVPGVGQAAVVAFDVEGEPGEKRLAGYWQPTADGPRPDETELRRALERHLPDYMVPSALVALDELPLTANGKVDRNALPRPDLGGDGDDFVAPRTPLEELVAELWEELLAVEQVGVGDHFFRLGGHSLSATRLVSRLRDLLEVEAPLAMVFDHPVLEAFARRLEELLVEEPGGAE